MRDEWNINLEREKQNSMNFFFLKENQKPEGENFQMEKEKELLKMKWNLIGEKKISKKDRMRNTTEEISCLGRGSKRRKEKQDLEKIAEKKAVYVMG